MLERKVCGNGLHQAVSEGARRTGVHRRCRPLGLRVRMTLPSPPTLDRHPRYEDKGHCIRGITMLVIKALIGTIRYDDVERPLNRPRVISTGISTTHLVPSSFHWLVGAPLFSLPVLLIFCLPRSEGVRPPTPARRETEKLFARLRKKCPVKLSKCVRRTLADFLPAAAAAGLKA